MKADQPTHFFRSIFSIVFLIPVIAFGQLQSNKEEPHSSMGNIPKNSQSLPQNSNKKERYVAANEYYYYDGQKIPLYRSRSMGVVQFGNSLIGKEEASSFFAAQNCPGEVADTIPCGQEEFSIVKFAELQGENAAAQALETLNARPEVTGTCPLFIDPKTEDWMFFTDQIVIKLKPQQTIEELQQNDLLSQVDVVEKMLYTEDEYILRVLDPKTVNPLRLANTLYESGLVQWAEPNFVQKFIQLSVPNDPLYPKQWHLNNIVNPSADVDAPQAWDLEKGSSDIVIAVLDDGVQTNHPDLVAKIFTNPGEIPRNGRDDDGNGFDDDIHGWDFANNDNNPNPFLNTDSHGTRVAGVAAASSDNNLGVTGICQDCRILPVKIANNTGKQFVNFNSFSAATAIRYAAQFADILNNSWGGGFPSEKIRSAIQDATRHGRDGKGSVVLFASGNSASGYQKVEITGLPPGRHRFRWEYRKNQFFRAGDDTAWLAWAQFPGGKLVSFQDEEDYADWTTGGHRPWIRVEDPGHADEGLCHTRAAKAGTIGDNQISYLETVKNVPAGDLTSFVWVSSEKFFDVLFITVDLHNDGRIDRSIPLSGVPIVPSGISFPASVPEAIAVGASSNLNCRSYYSQFGPRLDFVAPSAGLNPFTLDIATTDLNGFTGIVPGFGFNGTSAACPIASGVAGLILSHNPTLTQAEVRAIMRSTADKIGPTPYNAAGRNDRYGYGKINAFEAVKAAALLLPNESPTVAITEPKDQQQFAAPVNIVMIAEALDVDGTIAKVEFYRQGSDVPLGQDTTTPYRFEWKDVRPGNYELLARAIDDDGATTDSMPIIISVTGPDQMLAYWPFDDGKGCTAKDSIGNNNGILAPTCSKANSPKWTTVDAKVGTALQFDGDNDFVDLGLIGTGHPLQLANTDSTISCWFKQASGGDGWQRILDKSTGGNGKNGYAVIAHPAVRQIWVTVNGNQFISRMNAYELDDWTHLAVVLTDKKYEIYINGTKAPGAGFTKGSAWRPPDTAAPLRLGTWSKKSGGREFKGSLDDIRIFNKGLSAAEITELMGAADPLVAYWSLNKGQGNVVNDASRNSTHGRRVNGPKWTLGNGDLGSGLEFDGDNDFVDLGLIGTGHTLQLANTDSTLSCWFKQASGGDGWQRILDKSTGGNGKNGYAVIAHPAVRQIWVTVDGNTFISKENAYELDDWTHLAVVLTDKKYEIYINGTKAPGAGFTKGSARRPPDAAAPLRLGTWSKKSGGREFKGSLDDIRIFNKGLSAAEITELMGAADPLVAYWSLNEGKGDVVNDASRNNTHGRRVNGPKWTLGNGDLGSGLEFDGDNDFVDLGLIGTGHPLQLANTDSTISCWFKQASGGDSWQRILDKSTGGNGKNGYAVIAHPVVRQIWVTVNGNQFISRKNAYELDNWTHLAVVLTDQKYEIYINGTKTPGAGFTKGSARRPPDAAAPLRLGTWSKKSGRREFKGSLDDIRIFSKDLSAMEIAGLFDENLMRHIPAQITSINRVRAENLAMQAADLDDRNFDSTFNLAEPISKTIYEDAEDGTTDGWTVYNKGRVKNITDESGNHIIITEGNSSKDPFRLGLSDHSEWNNTTEFDVYFDVSFAENSAVYFRVETSEGQKYICYLPTTESVQISDDTIYIGLGFQPDGIWRTVTRNLALDLEAGLPGSQLFVVKDLFIYGSLQLDNVTLFSE